MNNTILSRNLRRSFNAMRRNRNGMTLIVVLTMLALMMVLVLGILGLGSSEKRAASVFSESVEVRTLADLPVNLVMGQIRQATSGLGMTKSWASQPGMIRVYNTSAGAMESGYKLYSSDQMVVTGGVSPAQEASAFAQWAEKPAGFTDLNQPVAVPVAGGGSRLAYPILDPAAKGADEASSIDGYSVSGAPGATTTQPVPMPVRWLYVLRDGTLVVPASVNDGKATFSNNAISTDNPIVGRVAFWTDDESCKVNLNTASEGTMWDVPRTCSWTDRNYGERVPAQNEFQRYPGHPATTSLSPVLKAFNPAYVSQSPVVNDQGGLGNASTYVPFLAGIYDLLPRTNFGSKAPSNIQSSQGGFSVVPANLTQGTPLKHERLFATDDEFYYNSLRKPNGGLLKPQHLQAGKFFLTTYSRAPETNLFNRPRISLWPQLKDAGSRSAVDKLIAFCSTCAKSGTTPQESGFWRSSTWQNEQSPGSALSMTEDFNLPQNQRVFSYLQTMTAQPVPGFHGSSFADKYDTKNRSQILLEMFDLLRWGVNSWYTYMDPATQKVDPTKSYYYTPPRAFSGLNSAYRGEAMALPVKVQSTPGGAIPADPVTQDATLKAFGRFPTIGEVCLVFMPTALEPATGAAPVTASAGGTPKDLANNFTGRNAAQGGGPDGWADNTQKMRAFIILQPFTPVVGMPPYTPDIRYVIEDFTGGWSITPLLATGAATPQQLNFPARSLSRAWVPAGTAGENAHCTPFTSFNEQFIKAAMTGDAAKQTTATDELARFPFFSAEVNVTAAKAFQFSGGKFKIKLYSGFGPEPAASAPAVQEIQVSFPATGSNGWFVPRFRMGSSNTLLSLDERLKTLNGANGNQSKLDLFRSTIISKGDVARSMILDATFNGPTGGDYRLLTAMPKVPDTYFNPHPHYLDDVALLNDGDGINDEGDGRQLIPRASLGTANDASLWCNEAQSLRNPADLWHGMFGNQPGERYSGRQNPSHTSGYLLGEAGDGSGNIWFFRDAYPAVPKQLMGAYKRPTGSSATSTTLRLPGDWDNGPGRIEDGPYINKPDEGGVSADNATAPWNNGYFSRGGFVEESGRSYSPNRQVCSAVAFGSLPTGIHPTNPASLNKPMPWQTLLFCPNPPSRTTAALEEPTEEDHYGFKAPRDHLMLDLFWMPAVEPYAISEPYSTAGKVNMNYQIMPFTHITRATALHAVMRSARINALPSGLANAGAHSPHVDSTTSSNPTNDERTSCYKIAGVSNNDWCKYETHYEVNVAETLKGFETRFAKSDIFRSASEICDIFLVPKFKTGQSGNADDSHYAPGGKKLPKDYGDMTQWWNGETSSKEKLKTADDGFELTGDNTRESPYNQLYPRLTTRSNVFQVHYRVQVLKKTRSSKAGEWDEAIDSVKAEYRGSTVIERYVDPNDKALPNFLADPKAAGAVDDCYRFRILRTTHFAP